MNPQLVKWAKFTAFISGGGLTAVFAIKSHDPASWGMALVALAGAVGTLLPSPSTSIVQDAPIVSPTGKTVAQNVTTTTTADIQAKTAPPK